MEKTNKMYMVSQFATLSLEDLKHGVLDWLSFIRILTTPNTCQFGEEAVQDFDLLKMKEQIQELKENENLWIKVNSQGGEFQLHISNKNFLERTILDNSVFFDHQFMIENYYDTRIEKNGIFGYIRSLDEYLFNNVEKVEKRTFETKEETEKLPKRFSQEKEIIVDCNQLAGFDIYYKGLCLTSCWKMYYSSLYFRVIPKQIFQELQQIQSIEELGNQVLKVTLFKDSGNWENLVNMKYQRLFRDQMGFDQLAWNNGIGVLREPYIEYAFAEEVVQTVQYQNDQYQPVEKKRATHFVTRSYDYTSNQYVENRARGILNAQAYFPWIDEKSQKMMNYRVLDPDLSIDNGISAYEFYIRQFLEIDVLDEKYQDFTSVLRFYLPKKAIETIPLEALKDKLGDINISNLKQKEFSTRFDLNKAKNHLRVVFLDYSYLESINETLDASE